MQTDEGDRDLTYSVVQKFAKDFEFLYGRCAEDEGGEGEETCLDGVRVGGAIKRLKAAHEKLIKDLTLITSEIEKIDGSRRLAEQLLARFNCL